MSATASCDFPLLNEWKEYSSKNMFLEVFDNVLSGFAQIALNDNSFSGIVLMLAVYIASPIQAISGIWAAFIGTITARYFGVSKSLIRTGVYGFNPALCGLAIPVLVFPESSLTVPIFIYSGLAAVFATVLTIGIGSFLAKWDVPSLALPYSTTLLLFVPASLAFSNFDITRSAPEIYEIVTTSGLENFGIWDFVTAFLNSIAQVLWIDDPVTGILYLVAVLMASRIDVLSTVIGALVSVLISMALGLPKDILLSGVYGFNAVLLMKAMTRGYVVNAKSYFVSIVLAVLTVVFAVSLRVIFAPIGAIASFAFPFAVLSILAFLGKNMMRNMVYVPSSNWGVPETIKKEYEEQQ